MEKEKQDTYKLQIKEVKNPSRQIQASTERMLWGVSAGICEFKGCTNKLYLHHITREKINFSEKAHIYAFSKGGKRYSLLKARSKINDIDNFIKELKECKITCLVDVRSSLRSSYYKDFDSDVLEIRLKNEGVIYRNYAFEFGARQGMAIFIPKGSDEDATRQRSFYDETYNYLKEIMS